MAPFWHKELADFPHASVLRCAWSDSPTEYLRKGANLFNMNKMYRIEVQSSAPHLQLRLKENCQFTEMYGQQLNRATEFLRDGGDITGTLSRPAAYNDCCSVAPGTFALSEDVQIEGAPMYWIFYESYYEYVTTEQGCFILIIADVYLDDEYNLIEGSDSILKDPLVPMFFRLRSRKRTDLFYYPDPPSMKRLNFKLVYEKMGMRGLVFIEEKFPLIAPKRR